MISALLKMNYKKKRKEVPIFSCTFFISWQPNIAGAAQEAQSTGMGMSTTWCYKQFLKNFDIKWCVTQVLNEVSVLPSVQLISMYPKTKGQKSHPSNSLSLSLSLSLSSIQDIQTWTIDKKKKKKKKQPFKNLKKT